MTGGWDGFNPRAALEAIDDQDKESLLPRTRSEAAPTKTTATTAAKRPASSVNVSKPSSSRKGTGGSSTSTTTTTSSSTQGLQKWIGLIIIATLGAMLVLYREEVAMVLISPTGGDSETSHKVGSGTSFTNNDSGSGKGWNFFNFNKNNKNGYCPSGSCNLLHVPQTLQNVQTEKQNLITQLKENYGEEYYPKLFVGNETTGESVGTTKFYNYLDGPQGKSRQRFIRKFKLKILEVQRTVKAECGCKKRKTSTRQRHRRRRRQLQEENTNDTTTTGVTDEEQQQQQYNTFTRFVWANGGHSASAAHGNYYDESYTAVMEASARATFGIAGIDLEGRNFAMGGTASAPMVALCNEAIFGLDADLVSWDFGMTDGHAWWKKSLYESRSGNHRNRPLMVDLGTGAYGPGTKNRHQTGIELEALGLAAMYYDTTMFEMNIDLPDMVTIGSQDQIDKVPPFLRYMRCGDSLEKDEPGCGAHKYTEVPKGCEPPGRVSWHPGWKAHALQGNVMALFMIDLLIETLTELEAATKETNGYIENIDEMISKLKSEEDADYDKFTKSGVPPSGAGLPLDENITKHVNISTFFHGPVFCHTAILPAQIRYLGILTENQNSTFERFDAGVTMEEAFQREDKTQMALVENLEGGYAKKTAKCPKIVDVDHKDFFMAAESDGGPVKIVVPNKMEQDIYFSQAGRSWNDLQGHILVCWAVCPWGKCPKGNIMAEQFNDGNATMTINGQQVKEMKELQECSLLQNEQGYVWKPNANGQYDIEVKIMTKNGYSRITTFIFL